MTWVYSWYPVWQPVQLARPEVRPLYSPHTPSGAVPQCSVWASWLRPLTSVMMSVSPTPGQLVKLPRYAAPVARKPGQYPAALATSGCLTSAVNLTCSPGAAWKSVRWVSRRPEVQLPAPSRIALMLSLPAPSRYTLAVLLLAVSTSPVPQLAAPPGNCVPVRRSQLAAAGEVLAPPSNVSCQTVLQPGSWVGEVDVDGLGEADVVVPPPPANTLSSHSE